MNKQELSNELSTYSGVGSSDPNQDMSALAGPVAEHIERLEARILELEKRAEPTTVNVAASGVDLGPGLSVHDIAELIRASK